MPTCKTCFHFLHCKLSNEESKRYKIHHCLHPDKYKPGMIGVGTDLSSDSGTCGSHEYRRKNYFFQQEHKYRLRNTQVNTRGCP